MSDALRAAVRRSTPLIFIPLMLILLASGCATSTGGKNLGLKQPSGPALDSADLDDDSDDGEFVADPLKEPNQAASSSSIVPKAVAKAHPKSILKTAFSQVGKPYRYGGSKPETGFDCSGFVKWVYGQYGIGLPRSSGDMMAAGDSVTRKDLKPGDLVFFGKKKRITHVGIYTGDNKYIHSPRTGKSIQESSLDDRGRGEYYVGARRLLRQNGLTAIDDQQKSAWVKQAEREMAVAKAVAKAESKAETKTEPKAAVKETMVASAAPSKADENRPVTASAAGDQPAEEKQPAPAKKPAAKNPTQHKVAAGDTIYTLARKYGVTRADLAKANNLEGEKAALLKLGQVLVIPGPSSNSSAAKTASAKGHKKHTVASGDTLYDLVRKYGVTRAELAKANNLEGEKVANLQLGQTLVIPPKSQ